DSRAMGWAFDLPGQQIASIVLRYTGAATNAGLAFDNFTPSVPLPPLTTSANASPRAVCAGDMVTLTGSASGGLPPYRFDWKKETDPDTWISVSSAAVTQVFPPADSRYRLFVTDALSESVTSPLLEIPVCDVSIEVSQESMPGAADFDENVLGLAALHVTDLSAVAYYGWTSSKAYFQGPAPPLTVDRSHLFALLASDGLALVTVHDAKATNGGGRAEMQFDLQGATAAFLVRDDNSSPDAYVADLDNTRFRSLHIWNSPNTDGLAIGPLVGDWVVLLKFEDVFSGTPTISGLTSWVAYSSTGSTIPLQLVESRRVRLRPIRTPLPDSDGDGVPDVVDACPNTIPGATVDASGCPPLIPGDCARDGDVDQDDYLFFEACATGPGIPQLDSGCACALLDTDADVDQSDFAVFQRCYSGENVPVEPNCGK
ncbi:MAG: hypothetical protein JW741_08000, partial [Sedimentisphaerales bacterium]|nr:hypothetical protein [Sedimentisphaerales bacterium]